MARVRANGVLEQSREGATEQQEQIEEDGRAPGAQGEDNAPNEEEEEEEIEEEEDEGDDDEKEGGDEPNEADGGGDAAADDDDGGDDDDDDDDDDNGAQSSVTRLGGKIETPAYALLTGIYDDPEVDSEEERKVISIPLTRIPAVLGRSHDTSDPNFFGLGSRKVLSRQQCSIYYRDKAGNQLEGSDELKLSSTNKAKKEAKDIIRGSDQELPEKGFFVVEALGKNRIFVNGQRVEQGGVALLDNGSKIKMNHYQMYFFLPADAPTKTIKLPSPAAESADNTKKRKKPSSGGTGKSGTALTEQLEATPVTQLLKVFFSAIEEGLWERKHQMIGGAITLHAVKDAARSAAVQELAQKTNGVSRSEVMDWIKQSKRYKEWVVQTLQKMEMKSYQANVTKCLWKAGYQRNAPVGRFVRWNLPSEELIGPGEPMSDEEEEEEKEENKEEKEGDGERTKTLPRDENESDHDEDYHNETGTKKVRESIEEQANNDDVEMEGKDDDLEDDENGEEGKGDKAVTGVSPGKTLFVGKHLRLKEDREDDGDDEDEDEDEDDDVDDADDDDALEKGDDTVPMEEEEADTGEPNHEEEMEDEESDEELIAADGPLS